MGGSESERDVMIKAEVRLTQEEQAISQGMWAASKAGKDKETKFLLEFPERDSAPWTSRFYHNETHVTLLTY